MISFLICGAQKCGTSALHEYLMDHPEISLSKTKELHIFDNETRDWSKKGIQNIDNEISKYFDDGIENKKRGEATPSSMWWKPAMRRIWQYNSQMKLIAVLRNPVTRAYSNWKMEVNKGREEKEFPLSIREEQNRCRTALPLQHRVYSYINRGMYTEQIKRIWEYFPRENLLLIKQEDLYERPTKILNEVYAHIGVQTVKLEKRKFVKSWKSDTRKENIKTKVDLQEEISEESKSKLIEIYKKEISSIEEITGWNCSEWYK